MTCSKCEMPFCHAHVNHHACAGAGRLRQFHALANIGAPQTGKTTAGARKRANRKRKRAEAEAEEPSSESEGLTLPEPLTVVLGPVRIGERPASESSDPPELSDPELDISTAMFLRDPYGLFNQVKEEQDVEADVAVD